MINHLSSLLRRLLLVGLLALALAVLLAGPVAAQEPTPGGPTADEVNAIAKELYCPVCENIPLDVCPTTACAQWRALIGEKLAAGWTEREIKDYFVQQYGDRVLATPPPRGLNWLVYVLPPAMILAGVYVLYRAFKAWKRPLPAALEQDLPEGPSQDEYVARLEEELRRR